MKKHNFLHRGIGWVERELEATLAILILLAAVVGYTLASTEAVTSTLTTQDAETSVSSDSLFIGTTGYSTLAFDRSYTSGKTYQVKKLALQPSTATTIAGTGLQGTTPEKYSATITLSETYSGKLYVIGNSAGATLNGTTITNQNTAVFVADATQLILNFDGIKHSFRGISINPSSTNNASPEEVSTLSLIPATAKIEAGGTRAFIPLATNISGTAISADKLTLKWSVLTSPTGIATIDSKGLVTATGAGTVTVKVMSGTKIASATVTVVAPATAVTPATPTATTPATTSPADKTVATLPADNGSAKSLFDKISGILTTPSADASTPTPTTSTITPAAATSTLFSDAAVISRVATTGTATISQKELNTTTTGMPLTQKIATSISVGLREVAKTLKEIAVGTVITDKTGTVIYQKPSAINLIFSKLQGLFSGASASTNDDDILRSTKTGAEGSEVE